MPVTSPLSGSTSNGGSWRTSGSGGIGDVELDAVREVDDAVAEVDLDHREAPALDDGRALAGRPVHEPDGAQRAGAVHELAQRRDGGVQRPDARHELDPVVLGHGRATLAAVALVRRTAGRYAPDSRSDRRRQRRRTIPAVRPDALDAFKARGRRAIPSRAPRVPAPDARPRSLHARRPRAAARASRPRRGCSSSRAARVTAA